MRHMLLIVTIALMFPSCGQNNTTQKELELQKKELELKQKELELKEKELSQNGTTGTNKVDTSQQKLNTSTPAPSTLTVTPLNISGDLGQVTFSQKGKTIFYYNLKSKKGKIKLNDTEYILDKYSENYGSFKLWGGQVSINAPNCKYDEGEGGDCFYGKFSVVTITLGNDVLKLNSVEVQNCPDMGD
jgi:hypothetical protein